MGDQRLLHSSVNVEEALLTLKPIGWEDCLLKRPVFHSFTDLFRMLDGNLPLKYVVLRWHLELMEAIENSDVTNTLKDVEILVNDYYAFKGLTGALSTNTNEMREQNNAGHIQSCISVAGHEVVFDVRYIGDGYIDSTWQSHMLKHRKRVYLSTMQGQVSFHVPSDEDYYFSLLYHFLVQKRAITKLAEKHSKYIAPLAAAVGVQLHSKNDLQAKAAPVWAELESFMDLHAYQFTKPTDPNVGFNTGNRRVVLPSANDKRCHIKKPNGFLLPSQTWLKTEQCTLRACVGEMVESES